MTFPANLVIGNLVIDSHFIFELMAYLIGFRYYIYLRKKTDDPINSKDRLYIFIGAVLGASVFARLLGIAENFPHIALKNITFVQFLGNKTIVGGLLGGLIGVEITKKIIGVKTSSGDLMTYPLIIGIIIGRIGCFLKGLEDGTYGNPTDLPWGIDFGDGITRHPTNLYEIIVLIFIGIIISNLEKRRKLVNGVKFKLFLSSYLTFRFFIEFIKPFYKFEFGISAIQVACLLGIIYYHKLFTNPQNIFERGSNAG